MERKEKVIILRVTDYNPDAIGRIIAEWFSEFGLQPRGICPLSGSHGRSCPIKSIPKLLKK